MPLTELPPKEKISTASEPTDRPFFLRLWLLFSIFMMLGLGVYMMYKPETIGDIDPQRKEKLLRELQEIDNAEQYVLLAIEAGNYPCLNCGPRSTIWLMANEIWRYGVTRKGEQIRYPSTELARAGLRYQIQFEGTVAECLKQEKIKIYNYAIHPENLRRPFRLVRPPGNPRDH